MGYYKADPLPPYQIGIGPPMPIRYLDHFRELVSFFELVTHEQNVVSSLLLNRSAISNSHPIHKFWKVVRRLTLKVLESFIGQI